MSENLDLIARISVAGSTVLGDAIWDDMRIFDANLLPAS